MDKQKILALIKKMGKNTKILISAGILALLIVILALAIFSPKGETIFSTETSLKEVLEISDLSTAEYTYNSIVEVCNDKGNTMYHVAYKGTVSVGINFEGIRIEESDDKISVVIPDVEIQNVVVETDIDYIFVKDKYNTETVYAEAYNACIADLKAKAQENQTLRVTAKESARDMVMALLRPIEEQLEDGQKFEVVFADGQ